MQRALLGGAAGCLLGAMAVRAQDVKPSTSMSSSEARLDGGAETLPQAPLPQPQGWLTLGERFKLEARVSFGVSALIVPAAEAGYDMARPPSHYPKDWKDGPGAFGRNYGAELARHTAGGLTRFATAAVDGEDPRYYPSRSRRVLPRFAHALWFTVSDKTNGGRRTLALSNFTGAAAAGFVGMPYEPAGYNDIPHATGRAGIELATYAGHNLVTEFSPELYRGLRAMHFPEGIAHVFVSEDPGKKP
jgi:hypothetical protein